MSYAREYFVGKKAEDLFKQSMEDLGWHVYDATKEENIKKHIDFHLASSKENKFFSVDVKAQKKTNRSDNKVNDEWLWIEFVNVRGAFGWLHGKADEIAFERNTDFLMINREKLKEFTFKKVENIDVDRASDAKYKFYSRKGRDDLLTQVSVNDLMKEVEYKLIDKAC
jgi:hypothetical protein